VIGTNIRWLIAMMLLIGLFSLTSCKPNSDTPFKPNSEGPLTKEINKIENVIYSLPDGCVAVGDKVDPTTKLPMMIKYVKTDSEMVLVPPGEFTMGTDEHDKIRDDNSPAHKIYLYAYYIDKYETTNAQYKRFVDAIKQEGHKWCYPNEYNNLPAIYINLVLKRGHVPDDGSHDDRRYDWGGGSFPQGKDNCPVWFVDWYDAYAYANWAGKRLPTEAEWEKAARGTDGRLYPWGNTWDEKYITIEGAKLTATIPVGSTKDISPYGCYDMASNVAEWCWDWYDEDYYKNSPYKNPQGLTTGESRVQRGGTWVFALDFFGKSFGKVVFRGSFAPWYGSHSSGFRCVLSPVININGKVVSMDYQPKEEPRKKIEDEQEPYPFKNFFGTSNSLAGTDDNSNVKFVIIDKQPSVGRSSPSISLGHDKDGYYPLLPGTNEKNRIRFNDKKCLLILLSKDGVIHTSYIDISLNEVKQLFKEFKVLLFTDPCFQLTIEILGKDRFDTDTLNFLSTY